MHKLLIAGACLLALSACGETVTEQAVAGGAVGGAGAIILDGSLLKGAVGGAAANIIFCQTYPSRCRR